MLVSARGPSRSMSWPLEDIRWVGARPTLNDHRSIFWGRRSKTCALRCNKSRRLCRRHVNIPSGNSFHRETLKPSSEKVLTFVNPVFPARVEYVKRLPAWRFARGANRKKNPPTHPPSRRSPLRNHPMSSQDFVAVPDAGHGVPESSGGGVRGERDHLVPLAQALPGMLLRSARENSR